LQTDKGNHIKTYSKLPPLISGRNFFSEAQWIQASNARISPYRKVLRRNGFGSNKKFATNCGGMKTQLFFNQADPPPMKGPKIANLAIFGSNFCMCRLGAHTWSALCARQGMILPSMHAKYHRITISTHRDILLQILVLFQRGNFGHISLSLRNP